MVETEKEASRVLEDEQMDFTRPLWRGKIKDLIAFECTDEKLRVHVGDINKDRRKHDKQLDHAARLYHTPALYTALPCPALPCRAELQPA